MKKAIPKEITVIGGIGELWSMTSKDKVIARQYHQQHRVVDKKRIAYALASQTNTNLVIKKI